MNIIAIVAASSNVTVLVFILMSNHVHFILQCSRDEAKAFIDKFKKHYGMYFQKKYGINKLLRANSADIREVPQENESLERALAYVQMNCVAANICAHPSQYPWGCGDLFFSQYSKDGFMIGSLPVRAQWRILQSRVTLPKEYLMLKKGYIDPRSYVPVRFVESLFRTPKRMNWFLMNSSKAKIRLESQMLPSFRDQVVMASMEDLCHSLFRRHSFDSLDLEEKSEMVRQLHRRFSADIPQIARITGLSYTDTARMLD